MSTLATTNIKHPSSASNNIVLDSSGNVMLQAGSASTPALQPSGDTNTGIFFPAADTIAFAEGGVESVRIDSSGRVGIGTMSPGGLLEITSASVNPSLLRLYNAINAASSWGIDFYRNAGGGNNVLRAAIKAFRDGNDATDLRFTTTSQAAVLLERMRIGQDGRIFYYSDNDSLLTSVNTGAGTTFLLFEGTHSANGVNQGTAAIKIFTNGNVQNTNNSYAGISDIKLKENVVDAGSQWDDLKTLQIRKYNFKEETGHQTHTQIGLIAQEVELISPGLVSESPDRDEDGNDLGTVTKSVNYSVLYMKAVKALQEAMERIEQLETEMAAVKAELS